ncbi:MAG TPA: VOC family protein [Polyangiaceae bacterium]|nr:VOC family protein [Polyangiaceae bacterium]
MVASKFCRYELRTTDLNAARAFYTNVLGEDLWGADVTMAPLSERALAMGGCPHWLGHVGVDDADAAANRLIAHGAKQLGPVERGTDGSPRIALLDPFGARVAVGPRTPAVRRSPVAWHSMLAEDHVPAFAWYAPHFGWTANEEIALGTLGHQRMFAWDESRQTVGSVANLARLPHVHAQWLFYFRVASVEEAIAKVRTGGGLALAPMETSSGDLVAACDDVQGAAFGLYQVACSPSR